MLFHLFYDYLLGEGVPEDHIITIALDDDLNIVYREPAELSRYIRSKVTEQKGMFYIFIDEVQYAISREELKNPEETHIMENIIYNELVCRGYSVDVGAVDIFETGAEGKRKKVSCEIDFVVNRGVKKYYIQSALTLGDARKERTEFLLNPAAMDL